MDDLPLAAQDYLAELSTRPGARQPASLSEIWSAEFSRAGLDTIGGIGKPFQDAYQDLSDAVEAAHGSDIGSLAAKYGVNFGAAVTQDQRVAALNRLADELPGDKQQEIAPLRDVRRNAARKAQDIEKNASDVEGATYGLSGTATAWLAGAARQTMDPVNLAAMMATGPLGGPIEGNLALMLGRQAGAAALGQAAVEPYIEPARGELGLESGVERAVKNIGGAAIGGAGLAGLFRGLAAGLRFAGDRVPVAPADALAAAAHAETQGLVSKLPERPEGTPPVDPVQHSENLAAAANAAEIPRSEPPRPQAETLSQLPLPEDVRALSDRPEVVPNWQGNDLSYVTKHVSAGQTKRVMSFGPGLEPKLLAADNGVEYWLDSFGTNIYATTGSSKAGDSLQIGPIVGVVKSAMQDGERVLDHVVVSPDFRRKGIGSRLLGFIEQANTDVRMNKNTGLVSADGAALVNSYNAKAATVGEPKLGADMPPKPLGDPALAADAARVATEAPDLELTVPTPDGGEAKLKVSDALKAVDEDAQALREMIDCMGGGGGEPQAAPASAGPEVQRSIYNHVKGRGPYG